MGYMRLRIGKRKRGSPTKAPAHAIRGSDRKNNENPVAEQFKTADLFEKLPLLAYKIGLDGHIVDCNRLAMKTLGYRSKKELVGKTLLTTIYAPSSREKAKKLFLQWLWDVCRRLDC